MMNVRVEVLSDCKYKLDVKVVGKVVFKNIKGFKVEVIEDNDIFKMGYDETDDNKEYLTITLEDGSEAMFRNSYVDMFREN